MISLDFKKQDNTYLKNYYAYLCMYQGCQNICIHILSDGIYVLLFEVGLNYSGNV